MLVGFTTMFFALCVLCPNIKTHCSTPGYYWKDLRNTIPIDALRGGTTVDNKPIYIGQVLYKYMLIPAKIYWNDPKRAFFEHANNKELTATQNIKILCAPYYRNYVWIKTNISAIKITRKLHDLIIGGYEPECTTYIGRKHYKGELSVGKVLTDNKPTYAGLLLTKDGEGFQFTEFEVLSFNPYQPLPFP